MELKYVCKKMRAVLLALAMFFSSVGVIPADVHAEENAGFEIEGDTLVSYSGSAADVKIPEGVKKLKQN